MKRGHRIVRRMLFALGVLSCSNGDPAHSDASSVAAASSGGDSSGHPVGSGGVTAIGVGSSSPSFSGGSTALGGSSGSVAAVGGSLAAGGSAAGAAGNPQTSGGNVSDAGQTTPVADGAAPPSDASSHDGAACDVTILLYPDCDGDGYAAQGAGLEPVCVVGTAPPPSECQKGSGSWTNSAPTDGATDCDDTDATVHPGSSSRTTADPKWGFDVDCDGKVTPEYSLSAVSSLATCVNATRRCVGDTGWVGATAPACGESALFSECRCFDGFCSLCQRVTATAVQACR